MSYQKNELRHAMENGTAACNFAFQLSQEHVVWRFVPSDIVHAGILAIALGTCIILQAIEGY